MTDGTTVLYMDGSDVGLGGATARDVNAFHILDDGSILLSIVGASSLPGVGVVDDSDIVRFIPTSLGGDTAGTFNLYFDGSDVGLSTKGEDIDALTLLDDGSLLISTLGSASVSGVSAKDEDLLRFVPSSLGEETEGTWSLYFDGSDVALTDSNEDVWGVSAGSSDLLYLTTKSQFSVTGAWGEGSDVITCGNNTSGYSTACDFALFWDGTAAGYRTELLDGVHVGQHNIANNLLFPAVTVQSDSEIVSLTIEDFNNGDVDDNGQTVEMLPETIGSIPLAVKIQTVRFIPQHLSSVIIGLLTTVTVLARMCKHKTAAIIF